MAPPTLQVLGACSGQPVAVTTSLGRGRIHASAPDSKIVRPGRPSKILTLSCRATFASAGSRGPIRLQRLHALSYQAVTADHDNGGGETPGPSVQAMDSSRSEWQGREDMRQLLADSWQGMQDGFLDLRQRGILQSTKDVLKEAKDRVQGLDAKEVVTNLRISPLSLQGARCWRTTEPWIKWPLVIFVPWFLLVTVFFGVAVTQDLLPLWILGPLGSGIVIRQSCQVAQASRTLMEKTAPSRELLRSRSMELFRDAKAGKLPEKARTLAQSKLLDLKQAAESKRSAITLYVGSGQAASDFKYSLNQKLSELWESAVDKYADVMEWWRPKGRVIGRFLRKIF